MRFRKLAIAAAVLALPAAYILHAAYADPPRGPTGEVVPPDEDVYVSRIVASGIEMLNATRQAAGDGAYRRDAHAKTDGCALANFTVNRLDAKYRQGLFAEPNSYKAWIRFSSGSTSLQSDWKPDARGMAIKVLGVMKTPKLLAGEEDQHTQDFLMINHPVFFVSGVKDYALLTKYQGQGSQFGYFYSDEGGFKWNLFRWRWREFRIGLAILKLPPPASLLSTRFYSMTAHQLGVQNYVKYSAKPVACSAGAGLAGSWVSLDRFGLSKGLASQLKDGPAFCFDLMVQLQVADQNMPVEDPTVEWSEKVSPFVPVARIEIPRQDVQPALQNGFCENLSFTPWHALPEHRPVGGLNRIRQAVYQGISRYRRCLNGRYFGEPKDDGSLVFDSKPCDAHSPVPSAAGQ